MSERSADKNYISSGGKKLAFGDKVWYQVKDSVIQSLDLYSAYTTN